jgi:hypothetical protein
MATKPTTLPGSGQHDQADKEPTKKEVEEKDPHKEYGDFLRNNSFPSVKDPPQTPIVPPAEPKTK